MSAVTDDNVLDRIEASPESDGKDIGKLREEWETIESNQKLATMSTGSRFIEGTVSTTVFHALASTSSFAILIIIFGFAIRKGYVLFKQMPNFRGGVKEMTLLMSPDLALLTILAGVGTMEVFNAILSRVKSTAPSVYVPFNQSVVRNNAASARFMQFTSYIPNRASIASMNKALRDAGFSEDEYGLDIEKYARLQNIQNYVGLNTSSFRNSCSFGLDVILGKMMSKAEQEIDSAFIKRFEVAVAEKDIFRSTLLKHMFNIGLGQDRLKDYTRGEMSDLYDVLVEDGIDMELIETSISVKDKEKAVEIIRESGQALATKLDALKREKQLVSLAAASHPATVSRTYKKREIVAAFSGSSKSVRDEVDKALAKDVRVEATFRNMNGSKMEELTEEILLVSEMVGSLSVNCRDKKACMTARSMCIQVSLIGVCLIIFACYIVVQEKDNTPLTNCYRYMAQSFPQLVNGQDVTNKSDAFLKQMIDPVLSEPSNYKLRTKFVKCSTDKGITFANNWLSIGMKGMVGIVVLFAVVAGIRTHFRDAHMQMEEESTSLSQLSANLKTLVGAIDDTGDAPILRIEQVKDLQLVVSNIKMYKNKVPYLAAPEDATTYPKLGKVAKYAIASCLALAAVFVVIKKMDPTAQLRRMRELKQTGGQRVGTFSGGSNAASKTLTRSDMLTEELNKLRGEGGAKETHTITLVVMLAVSAFTTVQLGSDILHG